MPEIVIHASERFHEEAEGTSRLHVGRRSRLFIVAELSYPLQCNETSIVVNLLPDIDQSSLEHAQVGEGWLLSIILSLVYEFPDVII